MNTLGRRDYQHCAPMCCGGPSKETTQSCIGPVAALLVLQQVYPRLARLPVSIRNIVLQSCFVCVDFTSCLFMAVDRDVSYLEPSLVPSDD